MGHQHGMPHSQIQGTHSGMMNPQQQQQSTWARQQQLQLLRQQQQQQGPQQSISNNGAPTQGSQPQFLNFPQGNMGANQMGGQNPNTMSQIPGVMNPSMSNPMGSGGQSTLQSQLQSQIPIGQIGSINQMGSAGLQSQRFGGRPGPVTSPMGPPTPISGPSASPRAMPTPSPRPHHPPAPSQSPHSVPGSSATSQLDILHSPQLQSLDVELTPQEQLSKYVEQL